MYKYLVSFPVCSFAFSAAMAQVKRSQNNYTVRVSLHSWDSSRVSIVSDGKTLYIDSARNEGFRLSGYTGIAKEGAFVLQTKRGVKISFPIFIEPGTIWIRDSSIKGSDGVLHGYVVSGTPSNNLLVQFLSQMATNYPMKFLDGKEAKAYDRSKVEYVQRYIQTHTSSLINLQLFRSYILNADISERDKASLFDSIDEQIRNSFGGKEVARMIDKIINTSVGQAAPLFTLPDTLGKSIGLSLFRGNYVFLIFGLLGVVPVERRILPLDRSMKPSRTAIL